MKKLFALLYAFVRPSVLGALYLLGLTAAAGLAAMRDERVLGVRSHAISNLIAGHFQEEIGKVTALLVAMAILAGAPLGSLAALTLRLRDRMARVAPSGPRALAVRALALMAVGHAWLWLYDIARRPQLYEGDLYAQGGLRRTLQVLVTDVLRPTGVVLVGGCLLLRWWLGPVRGWPSYGRRWAKALSPRRAPRSVGAIAAAVAALALVAFGLASLSRVRHASASPRSGRPNVLVIAADSLRADRIEPRVAPRLASLAARGTSFERAYVSLPRTFPSWVTMLTGRHPHHHGIRSMFPRWETRAKDLAPIPRRFAEAGYRTAVVSDYAGDIFRRVELGFETTDTPTFNFRELIRQRAFAAETPLLPLLATRPVRRLVPSLREMNNAADPGQVTADALRAIDRAGDQPFFVTVFYSTAHFPYAAPAPYYRKFTEASYRGRYKYDKPNVLGLEAPPDEADIRQIRGLYDGAVAAIDDAAADLLDGLARRGLADDTIVVVTADHGETLYDHGHGQGHGDHLYGDEGTHVPLIVVYPRTKAARRVTSIARDVDLAPTLCDLSGVAPPHGLDGRSLAPAVRGEDPGAALAFAETGLWFTQTIPEVPATMRLPYPDVAHLTEIVREHDDDVVIRAAYEPVAITAKHRMVRDERYKLVYAPTRDGVRYTLFDTEVDPGETHDVLAQSPEIGDRLKAELWRWMLEDRRMERRDGYLVPRPEAWSRDAVGAGVVRLSGGP